MEIAPQSVGAYREMVAAGACGVTLYQETYVEELYSLYHPAGSKASYDWRLAGLDRAAQAGMQRLGGQARQIQLEIEAGRVVAVGFEDGAHGAAQQLGRQLANVYRRHAVASALGMGA